MHRFKLFKTTLHPIYFVKFFAQLRQSPASASLSSIWVRRKCREMPASLNVVGIFHRHSVKEHNTAVEFAIMSISVDVNARTNCVIGDDKPNVTNRKALHLQRSLPIGHGGQKAADLLTAPLPPA